MAHSFSSIANGWHLQLFLNYYTDSLFLSQTNQFNKVSLKDLPMKSLALTSISSHVACQPCSRHSSTSPWYFSIFLSLATLMFSSYEIFNSNNINVFLCLEKMKISGQRFVVKNLGQRFVVKNLSCFPRSTKSCQSCAVESLFVWSFFWEAGFMSTSYKTWFDIRIKDACLMVMLIISTITPSTWSGCHRKHPFLRVFKQLLRNKMTSLFFPECED